jgi:aminoglycoside phosphotransferase (APT) family kinase protein
VRGRKGQAAAHPGSLTLRAGWPREAPALTPTEAEIASIIGEVLPGCRVRGVRPLAGGLVNTNVEVEIDRPPWRVALRLYQRGRAMAEKEMAIARLLADRVPHVEVLGSGERGVPFAVTTIADGEGLDQALTDASKSAEADLGAAVGKVLAAIHGIRFPDTGFFGPALRLGAALDFGAAGLLAFMRERVQTGRAGPRLGAPLVARLVAFARSEAHWLERWATPCLVHADFNPTNIAVLLGGGWEVTAVLDWEFALSAYPPLDFGTLLRAPFDARSAFEAGLAEGYRAAGGHLPKNWRHVARVADLFAWVDLLSRPEPSAEVIADGRAAIEVLVGGAL